MTDTFEQAANFPIVDSKKHLTQRHQAKQAIGHLCLSLLVLGVLARTAVDARADVFNHGPLRIEWLAPASCPDFDNLRNRLKPHDAESQITERFAARVRIEEEVDKRWRVVVSWSFEGGEEQTRAVLGASCAEVSEAALLFLSLIPYADKSTASLAGEVLDEGSKDTSQEDDGTQVPQAATASEAEKRSLATADPSKKPDACCTPAMMAGVVVERGGLPGLTPGLRISASLRAQALRLQGQTSIWLPKEARLEGNAGPGVRLARWTAGVAGCVETTQARPGLGLCVGMEIGDTSAVGIGVSSPAKKHTLWLAPRVAPELRWRLAEHWQIVWSAELAVPLRRPEFRVAPYGALYQSDSVAIRGHIGMEWIFSNGFEGTRH